MRIITAPLSDDERPVLAHGPNWIAFYDGAQPGDVACGTGVTETQAIDDLLARFPMERAA